MSKNLEVNHYAFDCNHTRSHTSDFPDHPTSKENVVNTTSWESENKFKFERYFSPDHHHVHDVPAVNLG